MSNRNKIQPDWSEGNYYYPTVLERANSRLDTKGKILLRLGLGGLALAGIGLAVNVFEKVLRNNSADLNNIARLSEGYGLGLAAIGGLVVGLELLSKQNNQ